MPLTAGTRLGPYVIETPLGQGGMGEVYRARDTKLNRAVALKILPDLFVADPDRLARFEREAEVLASLNHPNISQIYGVEESDRLRALVLELVEGPTLAEYLERGPIPVNEALPMARQIAEALETAHEHGIVHRDLKPANIKLRPDGTIKVLDFGLAKLHSPVDQQEPRRLPDSPTFTARATEFGIVLGTAGYMAPEQARGSHVDRRADVWSFGVVLYEMLAGNRCFPGDSAADTFAAIIRQEPDWTQLPADTPPSLRSLLRRCLDKDPRRRLRDIGEARVAIDDCGNVEVAPPDPPASGHRARSGAALAWGVAALLGVALLGITAMLFRPREPADAPMMLSTILPPEGTVFNFSEDYRFGPMAISPDSRQLAFSAMTPDGRVMLWVRSIDSLASRELPGTEGAGYPFWAPDSLRIGFFAGGKLKTIPSDGGVVDTLADAENGRGGTWNGDDVILFTPRYFAPILRVSARGGATAVVTTPDATRGETTNRFPWFLPDGRHFLYTAQNTTSGFYDRSTVRVGSLDGQVSRILFDADSNAVYSQGHLLYLRENTLVARPFDLSRLAVTAEAVTVATSIRRVFLTSCGVFTVSTGGLLLVQGSASDFGTTPTLVDRDGKAITTIGDQTRRALGILHLSRDRSRVSINTQSPAGEGSDIWIYDIARNLRERLSFRAGYKRAAIWSPDGRVVVFDSSRDGLAGPHELYVKATDGSGQEELLYSDEADKQPVSWSRDGRFLLFERDVSGRGSDLWVLQDPLGPSASRRAYPFAADARFSETAGQFSPDGRWIAYTSDQSQRREVYVAAFPGPGTRRQISTSGGSAPRWRADGREIFYFGDDDETEIASTEVVLEGTDLTPGRSKRLFDGFQAGAGYQYDVMEDGQRFVVLSRTKQKPAEPLTLVQNWTAGTNASSK